MVAHLKNQLKKKYLSSYLIYHALWRLEQAPHLPHFSCGSTFCQTINCRPLVKCQSTHHNCKLPLITIWYQHHYNHIPAMGKHTWNITKWCWYRCIQHIEITIFSSKKQHLSNHSVWSSILLNDRCFLIQWVYSNYNRFNIVVEIGTTQILHASLWHLQWMTFFELDNQFNVDPNISQEGWMKLLDKPDLNADIFPTMGGERGNRLTTAWWTSEIMRESLNCGRWQANGITIEEMWMLLSWKLSP